MFKKFLTIVFFISASVSIAVADIREDADKAFEEKKYELALSLYEQIAIDEPGVLELLFGSYIITGKYEQASNFISKNASKFSKADQEKLKNAALAMKSLKISFKRDAELKILQENAKNSVQGKYELATWYLNNKKSALFGSYYDYKSALKLLIEASDTGHTDANYALGKMYLRGIGVEANYTTAAKYLENALKNKHIATYNLIGEMLRDGKYYKIDKKTAYSFFLAAAKEKDLDAYVNLGLAFLRGDGVKKDYIIYENYVLLAAYKEHAKAQYLNGEILEKKTNTKDHMRRAEEFYKKSADQGFQPAINKIADIYLARKEPSAIAYFEPLALGGNVEAEYVTALMYQIGLGGENAEKKYMDWYRKADKHKHSQAAFNLGLIELDLAEKELARRKRLNVSEFNFVYLKALRKFRRAKTLGHEGTEQIISALSTRFNQYKNRQKAAANKKLFDEYPIMMTLWTVGSAIVIADIEAERARIAAGGAPRTYGYSGYTAPSSDTPYEFMLWDPGFMK